MLAIDPVEAVRNIPEFCWSRMVFPASCVDSLNVAVGVVLWGVVSALWT